MNSAKTNKCDQVKSVGIITAAAVLVTTHFHATIHHPSSKIYNSFLKFFGNC